MKKIFIAAGEASGDQHAAHLIHEAKKNNADLYFYGMGGEHMRRAGAEILINNQTAVIGVSEIIKHLPRIYQIFKQIKHILKTAPPDLLILVDYPEFNLRLAKFAKKCGIKVLYYISPTVWAWRQGRVNIIKRCVNKIAVIFPFEKKFYETHQVPVAFVGNPSFNTVKTTLNPHDAYALFQLKQNQKILGLLPGSRHNEIKNLLPVMLEATKLLKNKFPDLQIIIPLAATIQSAEVQHYLNHHGVEATIVRDQTYNAIAQTDAVIATSGTVTLETALLKKPLVIIYKLSKFSYYLGRLLIKAKFIGLCNIVADASIAKELIQEEATPEAIADEIVKILEDKPYRENMIQQMEKMREAFGELGEVETLGEVVRELLP